MSLFHLVVSCLSVSLCVLSFRSPTFSPSPTLLGGTVLHRTHHLMDPFQDDVPFRSHTRSVLERAKKYMSVYICALCPLDVSFLSRSSTLITGQGEINCGPSRPPDFIKYYSLSNFLNFLQISPIFLSNSLFSPIPNGRVEQLMTLCHICLPPYPPNRRPVQY